MYLCIFTRWDLYDLHELDMFLRDDKRNKNLLKLEIELDNFVHTQRN